MNNLQITRAIIGALELKPVLTVRVKCFSCRKNKLYLTPSRGTYFCEACGQEGILYELLQAIERREITAVDPQVMAAYLEDVHRPLLKPGRGEKNKSSPKRMTDNRYKEPWSGYLPGTAEEDE